MHGFIHSAWVAVAPLHRGEALRLLHRGAGSPHADVGSLGLYMPSPVLVHTLPVTSISSDEHLTSSSVSRPLPPPPTPPPQPRVTPRCVELGPARKHTDTHRLKLQVREEGGREGDEAEKREGKE